MDLEDFREYCLNKRRVTEDMPFGEDVLVFKVDGKIFALASLDEVPPRMNLKCDPELALELRAQYKAVGPGYHQNKRHWNTVEVDGDVPDGEWQDMIDHSYELVVNALPKAERAKLPFR